jgi:hypothetical protein
VEDGAADEIGTGDERDGEPDSAPGQNVTAPEADGAEECSQVVWEAAPVVEDERRPARA